MKILINQSEIPLTSETIEVLCLGLGFIPSHTNLSRETCSATEKLIFNINTKMLFRNRKDREKGWITKYIPSDWTPPKQTWENDPRITPLLEELRNPPTITRPIFHSRIERIIKNLQKRTDIHILKSDKGRNIVIWKESDYDREANRQLADIKTYHELSYEEFHNKLKKIKNECSLISENLLAFRLISEKEDEAIRDRAPTGSYIYFLPKVHKNEEKTSKTFPGRPIVATFTSVSYLLDKYITEITSHLLAIIPGSLIDTQDFIKALPTGSLPDTALLVTADVVSLYPNIPWEDGIHASTQFYAQNLDYLKEVSLQNKMKPPPTTSLFKQILTLVLSNSMIIFKNQRFFHQLKGTAMGCCISVYFANCYMYSITKHLIESPPSWLVTFLRFIDDLFLIITHPASNELSKAFTSISNRNIRYELTPPSKQQFFLDTKVSIKNNRISISPYTKDTASGSYLHPGSTHPQHTIRSIPYSQLLRIRRNSSNIHIFKKAAKPMMRNFFTLGYNKRLIQHKFHLICKEFDKNITSNKTNHTMANAFKFITNYNKVFNWPKIRDTLDLIHQFIILHYKEEGPYQNKKVANFFESNSIKLVTSNEPNINSFFSKKVKNGNRNSSEKL
jgi:hypothetical protein